MKQLTAIFLIALFFFNLVGYRALFYYQQQRSTAAIESKIDNENYDEAELVTVRIDLDMPYQAQQTSFERVDGEIEVDGIVYKYVRRKIDKGQLVLQCIPDAASTKIQSARDSFFKISNSLMQDKGSKDGSSKQVLTKNLVSDYDDNRPESTNATSLLITARKMSETSEPALAGNRSFPEQPPELS